MGLLTILKKVKEEEHEIRILVLGLDNAGKTTIVKRLCGQPINEIEPTLGFTIHTLDYNTSNSNSNTSNVSIANTNSNESNANTNASTNASNTNSNESNTSSASNTDDAAADCDQGEEDNDNDNNNDQNHNQNQNQEEYEYQDNNNNNNYKLHLWDIGGQSTIRAYWRNYFEKTDGIIWVIDSNDRQRLKLVKKELSSVLKQERLAGSTLLIMANKMDLQGSLTIDEIGSSSPNGLCIKEELLVGQTNTRHWKIQGCSGVTKMGLSEGIDWLINDITDRIFFTG